MPSVPKTLGACADRLYVLDQQVKEHNRAIAKLEEEEKAIKEHLIQTLPKDDAKGVMGKQAKVVLKSSDVPTVDAEDGGWEAFYAYVKKHNAFELLQRRLSDKAIRERWDERVVIPGVKPFRIIKVSVTKV